MLHHMLRAAAGASFDPLSLSPLVFYDPLDISTLWQDTGGTTAVTADGQRVRRMDDISGNGYHANFNNGMIYRTDGWMEAVVSTDALATIIPAQVYPFFMIGACGRNGATGSSGSFFVSDPSGTSKTAGIYYNDTTDARALVTNALASTVVNSDQQTILSLSARTGNQRLYCNSVSGNSLNAGNQTGLTRLSISSLDRSSPVYHLGENGGFLFFDYDIGDANRVKCEQWMAERYGVTI